MAKRKKNENGEELETIWEVFMRNYKNVPGFKELVKLLGYFLFFALFILIVVFGQSSVYNDNQDSTTTTTTNQIVDSKTYKEMLEDLYKSNKTIHINITTPNEQYVIDAQNEAGILTGFMETTQETTRFKIENNIIYELNLDNQTENAELFKDINVDFIIPANLVNTLENSKATKRVENDTLIYNYNLENYGNYIGEVIVLENKINSIKLTNETASYEITFE